MHNKFLTLILQNLVLFPNQEVKLEFNNDLSKQIIDTALKDYNGEIVMVSPKDELETNPDIKDLPDKGILCKLKTRIDLPNGNMRINLRGVKRIVASKYISLKNGLIEVITEPIDNPEYSLDDELVYTRKLKAQINNYVETDSRVSNSILGITKNVTNLSKLTDMISAFFEFDQKQKRKLFEETNYYKRARVLITLLNNEIKSIDLENKLDDELRSNFEKSEKDIMLREKINILSQELGVVGDKYKEASNYITKLESLKLKTNIKNQLMEEIKKFETTIESSPELPILRTYLDTILNMPWNKSSKDNKNIDEIDKKLNKLHYGLDNAKNRIEEYLILKNKNNDLQSPVLCLIGPPGTGKTTFARELANSIGRAFIKISVGGLNDSSELIGHRRTYIGAGPGKIADGIRKCGYNNPVILIDEIDKMVKDNKGDPASTLLEILDYNQNKEFIDNYLAVPFNLSNVIFILTANDENTIPDALYDRLEVINVSSYTIYDKIEIAKNYTLPRLGIEYNFDYKKISISTGALTKIITDYTEESGVRELERNIGAIVRKVLIRGLDKKVSINTKDIINYLGNIKYSGYLNTYDTSGSVNVPAYTPLGGCILNIETSIYPGKEETIVTGSLGEVMIESIEVAISYIKVHAKELKINTKKFDNSSIHVHALDGSSKKDGPSAGLAITTSLVSLLLDKKVPNDIAFTGEISLNGRILKIGGLKEKIISSYNKNIKIIYIPKENECELSAIPKKIIESIEIRMVSSFTEVYRDIFK